MKENEESENEVLFWKVFHNKYLLNYIIEKIHTTEWIEYDNHQLINIFNRMKFKNIVTFGFMIQQGLYELIKTKINHNEYIHFNDPKNIGINIFFNMVHTRKEIEKERSSNISIFRELLNLIMNKRRNEFENVDLTEFAVLHNNIEALKILTCDDFKVQILPSTVLLALQKGSDPELIKLVLQSPLSVINNHVKNNSLRLIFSNTNMSNSKKEQVINSIIINCLQKKQLISLTKESELFEIVKIKLQYALDLESTEIINQLLDLDCFDISSSSLEVSKIIKFSPEISVELFIIYIRIYFKYINKIKSSSIPIKVQNEINKIVQNQDNEINKTKKLQELLVIESKAASLYNKYLLKWDEPIDELKDQLSLDLVYVYCFSTFSINSLKQLLLNKYENKNKDDNIKISSKIIKGEPNRVIQFIKYCCSNLKLIKQLNYEKIDYLKIAYQISDNEELYYEFIELVPRNKMIELKLPYSWCPIFPILVKSNGVGNLVFKDKEEIDWLIPNSTNKRILDGFLKFKVQNQVKFKSIELIKYAQTISSILFTNSSGFSIDYSYSFYNAISECNIKELTLLGSMDWNSNTTSTSLNAYFKTDQIDTEKVEKMINCFNNLNYKMFSSEIFEEFIIRLLNSYPNLVNIVNYTKFKPIPSIILIDLITNGNGNLNLIKQLLPEIDPSLFITQWNYRFLNKFIYNSIGRVVNNSKFNNFEEIKQTIEFWIQQASFKKVDIKVIQKVLNYLYDELLSHKSTTVDDVLQIYNQIKFTSGIGGIENNDLYRLFFYLHIKSVKFTKYILSRPLINNAIRNNLHSTAYNCSVNLNNFEILDYDIRNYLDPSVFTMEFIFNSSFDTVISSLKSHLSHNPIEKMISKYPNYFNDTVNSDLLYFIHIGRKDLFFKELQFISKKLDEFMDGGIEIGEFPSQSLGTKPSPYDSIKPTSIYYSNFNKDDEEEDNLDNLYDCVSYFKFSDSLLYIISKSMTNEEIQEFLEFNSRTEQIHYRLLRLALGSNIIQLVDFLLQNYELQIGEVWNNMFSNENTNLIVKHLFNNYPELLKTSNQVSVQLKYWKNFELNYIFKRLLPYLFKREQLKIKYYHRFISNSISIRKQVLSDILNLDNYEELKDNSLIGEEDGDDDSLIGEEDGDDDNKEDESVQFQILLNILKEKETIEIIKELSNEIVEKYDKIDFLENGINIFEISFLRVDIEIIDLLLKSYPNQFKINENLIKEAIGLKRIHVIKHYYENQVIENHGLLEFTNQILKNNSNYKYLNWLK